MAKKKGLSKKVRKQISAYLYLLKKEGIKVEKAIVFGSRAKGTAKFWSDIDICLVSKQFGKDFFEEGLTLSRLARQVDVLIEPHLYRPTDFKEKYDPLAAEVRRHGIVVT